MTTLSQAGATGMTTLPAASARPGPVRPGPARIPLSEAGDPREDTLDTRALARALREQRVTIIDQTSAPSADYLTIKVTKPRPGMDPRTIDALRRIRNHWPTLSRRKIDTEDAPLTAEGYRAALALLSPLLRPRARGEAPRWKQGVTSQQVSALIDTLTKTKTGP